MTVVTVVPAHPANGKKGGSIILSAKEEIQCTTNYTSSFLEMRAIILHMVVEICFWAPHAFVMCSEVCFSSVTNIYPHAACALFHPAH